MSYRDEVSLSMVACTTVKECEGNNGTSNVSVKSTVIAAMDIFKAMTLQSFVDENIVKRL